MNEYAVDEYAVLVGGRSDESRGCHGEQGGQYIDGDKGNKVQGRINGVEGWISTLRWEGRVMRVEDAKASRENCIQVRKVTKGMENRERITGVGEWVTTLRWGRSEERRGCHSERGRTI